MKVLGLITYLDEIPIIQEGYQNLRTQIPSPEEGSCLVLWMLPTRHDPVLYPVISNQ
jgi:hypothetical protein